MVGGGCLSLKETKDTSTECNVQTSKQWGETTQIGLRYKGIAVTYVEYDYGPGCICEEIHTEEFTGDRI